jgi:serine/threonine-protein kinase
MSPTPNNNVADREERLDQVLASYFKAVEAGEALDPKTLIARHPDLAVDLENFFANEKRLDRLATPLRTIRRAVAVPETGQAIGDYEILGEIAHGGMGVVYRARQKSLGRVVALKMMRAGPLATPRDRQRFKAEAEAFAQLDHPNIVPIYEVGEEDGRLFFSMKLLEGGSLADHIERFGKRQREAARLMATVAEAVHFAHQRGFLHRDLKPANILLDREGQPHVTDFGLAKRMIDPDAGTEAGITQTGAILGTPSYMAPEQASGVRGGVTLAADVYGLGAIIYELLTGRPPFRGETPLATLQQAQEQEPERPSSIARRVDRDLETICLKCLEKDPRRRYASAQDLADDLRRYVEGRPIVARPVGTMAAFWRWCQRKPLVASLSAALTMCFFTGFALVTVQWQRAEANARAARDNAKQAEDNLRIAEQNADAADENARKEAAARVRAEKAREKAQRAVDRFYTVFSERDLLNIPGMQAIRKDLLDEALAFYQDFARESVGDPKLDRDLADAKVRVAKIRDAIGSREEALAAYVEARATYQKLVDAKPRDFELRSKLAWSHSHCGILLMTTGRTEEGLKSYERAREMQTELLREQPDSTDAINGLATTDGNMGIRYLEMGKLAQARPVLVEARELREKLVARQPQNSNYQDSLAGVYNMTSLLYDGEHRPAQEVYDMFQKAVGIREKLVTRCPRIPHFQRGLAEIYGNLGRFAKNARDDTAALVYYEKAFQLHDQLVRENPTVNQFRRDLAGNYLDLGGVHSSLGDERKALEHYQEARVLQERLVRDNPKVPAYRKDLARSYQNIAVVMGRSGNRDDSIKAYEKSRDILQALLTDDPRSVEYRIPLASTLRNLGMNLAHSGQVELGRQALYEAISHQRYAFKQAPTNASYRHSLNYYLGSLSEIERAIGKLEYAATITAERRDLYPDDPKELYLIASYYALLADTVAKNNPTLSDKDRKEQDRFAAEAVMTLRQAVKAGFKNGAMLRRDKTFERLRGRQDFQELLKSLPGQATPRT